MTLNGLATFTIDGSGNLTFVDSDDQGNSYNDVWTDGNYIYIANPLGVMVYTESSGVLTYIGITDTVDSPARIAGDGNYIFVMGGSSEWIKVYAVGGGGSLTLVQTIEESGSRFEGAYYYDGYLYVCVYEKGLYTYSVTTP